MSDIYISNGTCYTAAGKQLDSSFIPCGNTAFGYQTCCGAGDNCLADLACFGIHGSGYGSYLTYYAGCTDPTYSDAKCPNKDVDQPWVALTLCDNSDGAWAICSQSGNPTTLQPGSYCSCTNSASATVAFKDATVLADYASLPGSTGDSISFFAGHTPTGTPTAAASGERSSTTTGGGVIVGSSSSSVTGSGTSGARTSATPLSSSDNSSFASRTFGKASGSSTSSSSSSGSSGTPPGSQSGSAGIKLKSNIGTGAIAGIVVGAILGFIFLAAIIFIFMRRRRRQAWIAKEKNARDSALSTSPIKPGGLGEYIRPATPPVPEVDGAPVSEVGGTPAKPWVLRSELEGKEISSGRSSALRHGNEDEGSSDRYELP